MKKITYSFDVSDTAWNLNGDEYIYAKNLIFRLNNKEELKPMVEKIEILTKKDIKIYVELPSEEYLDNFLNNGEKDWNDISLDLTIDKISESEWMLF